MTPKPHIFSIEGTWFKYIKSTRTLYVWLLQGAGWASWASVSEETGATLWEFYLNKWPTARRSTQLSP